VKKKIVYFRAGTHIELNPRLVRRVGIDGYLEDRSSISGSNFIKLYRSFLKLTRKMSEQKRNGGLIPPNVHIEVIRLPDRQMVARTPVESDGFFVLEGLVPGSFLLRTTGFENPPPPYRLDISQEQTWISNLVIQMY